MIAALRNPGMRDRHYRMLSKKLGFHVKATPSFTVSAALKLNLPNYISILDEVSLDVDFLLCPAMFLNTNINSHLNIRFVCLFVY